jgi:hypothetical protein
MGLGPRHAAASALVSRDRREDVTPFLPKSRTYLSPCVTKIAHNASGTSGMLLDEIAPVTIRSRLSALEKTCGSFVELPPPLAEVKASNVERAS